jgi:hypothetical protein
MTISGLTFGLSILMENEILRKKFSASAIKVREQYSFIKHVRQWEVLIE